MSCSVPEDYYWLAEKPATLWLTRLMEYQQVPISLLRQMREEVGETRTALLNQQIVLRKRAQRKFSAADRMLFTDRGLQQATDELVAHYKAARFGSIPHVTDLCCGIGGDLLALAKRGSVLGVDRDPVATWLAHHNAVAVLGQDAEIDTRTADVCQFDLSESSALHLDPDRRSQTSRHAQIQGYVPGLDFIEKQLRPERAVALKLAPAATVPESWLDSCERQWIVSRGECRQQVVWWGPLASTVGVHTATCLSRVDEEVATVEGMPGLPVPDCSHYGRYLYEPNPAILAAGLVGAVAQQYQLFACWDQVAYLTSDQYHPFRGFSCFEIEEVLPFDRKRLKSLLRKRQIGRLEVKKRGTRIDPAQVQKQLQGPQAGQATLLLAGTATGVTAILAQRRSVSASQAPSQGPGSNL